MTTSEMTDAELNEAIAAAIGGALANPGWYWFRGTGGTDGFPDMPDVPGQEPMFSRCPENAFATSIDALSAVEAKIASAGTGWGLYVHLGYAAHAEWSNGWVGHPWVRVETSAPTEARARAEAALLALRAIEPTSITTLARRETGS